MLRPKSLTINVVTDVSGFPDLYINLAILRARLVWIFGHRFQLQHLAFSLQHLAFRLRLRPSLDSGLHAAVAMSGRVGCDARVLQVLQKSQFVAPL